MRMARRNGTGIKEFFMGLPSKSRRERYQILWLSCQVLEAALKAGQTRISDHRNGTSEALLQGDDKIEKVHGIEFDLVAKGPLRVQVIEIGLGGDGGQGVQDDPDQGFVGPWLGGTWGGQVSVLMKHRG